MSSWTSFGKLESVIVGNESNFSKTFADMTFKYFYQSALGHNIYEREEGYTVTYEHCIKRNQELDNLAKVIQSKGVEVLRPDLITKPTNFSTPEFKSMLSPASNVRDVSIVYGPNIIETPVFVRNRYFENTLLYDIYNDYFLNKDYNWVRFPHAPLTEDKIDFEPWESERDYINFDRTKYSMGIDGAQFLRIGKDVIVNINSYNHFLGLEWFKKQFPETNFHIVNIADNHIDGALICLRPGTFLVNPKYPNMRDLLPQKFKNWEYIYPKETNRKSSGLASSNGMDINILSLDENTVVTNSNAIYVNDILDKNGFDVITSELNFCEMFGGGIHCSTLDLRRKDEYIEY